ncbi:MAG: hypothetical protein ACTS3R_14135 [Inquilinaceae bacterium]
MKFDNGDCDTMTWTLNDDIRLYARAFSARRGTLAGKDALDRAAELAQCGDFEGYEVWRQVAQEVDQLQRSAAA